MEIDNIGVICKGDHKIRDGRTDVSDHNTADDQHGHIVDLFCHQQDKTHGDHGTDKGCNDHGCRSHGNASAKEKDHKHGHYQLGSGRDSQYKGTGYRVIEKGLQEKSGYGQGSSQDNDSQDPGQTDFPYNVVSGICSLMPEYNIQNLSH